MHQEQLHIELSHEGRSLVVGAYGFPDTPKKENKADV